VGNPNYLTPSGAQKLQEELRHLASIERPKIVTEVADAAAQGDRSENAEYIYGKKRLREIDRRIHFLTKRLESAVIVDPSQMDHDEVRFGATVVVEDEEGNRKTYVLVGTDESDPAQGALSYLSPVGKALMKRRVGDTVTVRRPVGDVELEIIQVSYAKTD
jgi:transcription elongation factor GreB